MSNPNQLSEPGPNQPDQPPTELDIARMTLVETIAAKTRARLLHFPGLRRITELIDTGQIDLSLGKEPGDLAGLPSVWRAIVRSQVDISTPQDAPPPPDTPQ